MPNPAQFEAELPNSKAIIASGMHNLVAVFGPPHFFGTLCLTSFVDLYTCREVSAHCVLSFL